jgi:hypothetical protein
MVADGERMDMEETVGVLWQATGEAGCRQVRFRPRNDP